MLVSKRRKVRNKLIIIKQKLFNKSKEALITTVSTVKLFCLSCEL